MAGLADSLRGDGLAKAQRALAGLKEDPARLDRERMRFNRFPSPILVPSSPSSGITTRSPSPIPPSEERRQQRRMQLAEEYEASEPRKQFASEVEEERRRIWNADPNTSGRELTLADLYTFQEEASEAVRNRWVEQGIWNDRWDESACGRWKHEEPLESEAETHFRSSLLSRFSQSQPKPRPSEDNFRKRLTKERQTQRQREREASRPYNQFIYQISKERERIQEQSVNGKNADPADINTKAYESVKNKWNKRGIWNEKWGILPGMSWKHEQSFEEMVRNIMDDDSTLATAPNVNGSHEAPTIHLFGSPHPASGALKPSQQARPLDIAAGEAESGESETGESETGESETGEIHNSPPAILANNEAQALLSRKRKAYHQETQPADASVSHGPLHPSKVAKPSTEAYIARQKQLIKSRNPSSGGISSPARIDTTEPQPSSSPDRVTPRRSKRIQSTETPPSNPLTTRVVQPKSNRKDVSNTKGKLDKITANKAQGKVGKK